MDAILIALAVLIWVVTNLVKFFRWMGRRIRSASAAPSPIQQAMAESQRQAETVQQAEAVRQAPVAPRRERRLRPEDGPPAVPQEATSRDFGRQEQELLTEEPAPLGTPLRSDLPLPAAGFRLFESNDDLVRAVILQEALGPPLCRRRR